MRRAATIAFVWTIGLVITACGSDGGDPTSTSPRAATPADVASVVAGATPAAGDECTTGGPPNLHSTSHEVNVPTSEQVIEMAWSTQATQPASYAYAFSQNPQEPPDQLESLPGDATEANSGPLGQNRWYFYLLPEGETQPVRCGPYVIDRDAPADGGAGGGGGADTVTLAIAVDGGSSVEFFTNQGERLVCGDTSLSLLDVTCSADFVRGSEVRVQRTLSLPVEEEARWRLFAWGGSCEGLDADAEPRGGQCMLTMDEDRDVSVSFEERATITITHTGPSQLLLRWGIDYQPAAQKGGGNPLTLRGQFDCDTDSLADCTKTAFFDTGTTIILTAGTGVDAGNLASISGACNTSESTCEFSLDADSVVTFNWQY